VAAMKIASPVASSCLLIGMALFLTCCSSVENNKEQYLQKVLNNLNRIESATYYTTTESWAPGDTAASGIFYHYVKEFDNPADTTIGASFVKLLEEDTAHMTFCYDGKMRAIVYNEDKTIAIDSFNVRSLPFRPIAAPFFNYTRSIIKYALETNDSIALEVKEQKDSYYVGLTIYEDHKVEFFGKAFYIEIDPYDFGETTSKYELWISKSSDLPYRFRREMSDDINVITCRNASINTMKLADFRASDYFEPEYAIEYFYHGNKSEPVSDLTGKVAPDWVLTDATGNAVALKDLKSKILLIQFTSVTCGPCKASIPFLKQLVTEYDRENFDFAAIESWTKNSDVLKSYQRRNNFNYKFLLSTREVTESYQIKSVPVFFILDENRVILRVIKGYGEGTTDKEIRDAINALI
jgi:thiol-disulfide isomerase/thioredoxin